MTTARSPLPATTDTMSSAPSDPGLPVGGLLASEAVKLRSVRSTWWTLAVTVGLMIGFGALLSFAFVSRYDHLDLAERVSFDPTLHSLRGLFLAQLAIGVLGVLAMTNEYSTGMIRNTFAAVPQRSAVLGSKLAVFAVGAAAVAVPTAFATFFVGQSILTQKHIQASIGDPGVLRAVLASALYLVGVGVLGLGLGALLRRTAGAITALVGLVLVLPLLASALPSPWNTDVGKLLPGNAGQAMLQVRQDSDFLTPTAGFVLFCGYIVVVVVAAFITINRRDA